MTLLFKKLSGGKYCIIENQRVCLFDRDGKCLNDNIHIAPKYVNGAVKMNYISILSSGKYLEVAVFVNDTMVKYSSSLSPEICVMKAFSYLKSICVVRRDGKQDNINYNQAIFVVSDEYTWDDLVEVLQLTELK